MNYDRRTAALESLKPMVEEASSSFKKGFAEIERARSLMAKVAQGAASEIPRGYTPTWIGGPKNGDEAHKILDYASHLRDELDEIQRALKKCESGLDEFLREV